MGIGGLLGGPLADRLSGADGFADHDRCRPVSLTSPAAMAQAKQPTQAHPAYVPRGGDIQVWNSDYQLGKRNGYGCQGR